MSWELPQFASIGLPKIGMGLALNCSPLLCEMAKNRPIPNVVRPYQTRPGLRLDQDLAFGWISSRPIPNVVRSAVSSQNSDGATKMNLKTQEIDSKSSQKEDASRECLRLRGPADIFFLITVSLDFLRFEIYFSCSVWVLRRDSILAHVWYGSYELIYH